MELRAFHRRQISLPPQPATTAQIDSWTRASNPLVTALSKKLVKRIGSGDPTQLDSAVQEMVGLFLEKENTLDLLRREAPQLHETLAAIISRHAAKLSFYGNPERDATPYPSIRG